MTDLLCPICGDPLLGVRAVPWRIKMIDLWSDGMAPFAVRKRGTDFAGTCARCEKLLLVEARGPRYAEIPWMPES